MAPLLGRKPFPLAKPLPPGEPPGERFVIAHTQEAFRSSEWSKAGQDDFAPYVESAAGPAEELSVNVNNCRIGKKEGRPFLSEKVLSYSH